MDLRRRSNNNNLYDTSHKIYVNRESTLIMVCFSVCLVRDNRKTPKTTSLFYISFKRLRHCQFDYYGDNDIQAVVTRKYPTMKKNRLCHQDISISCLGRSSILFGRRKLHLGMKGLFVAWKQIVTLSTISCKVWKISEKYCLEASLIWPPLPCVVIISLRVSVVLCRISGTAVHQFVDSVSLTVYPLLPGAVVAPVLCNVNGA